LRSARWRISPNSRRHTPFSITVTSRAIGSNSVLSACELAMTASAWRSENGVTERKNNFFSHSCERV
jgi:hypothetical protein